MNEVKATLVLRFRDHTYVHEPVHSPNVTILVKSDPPHEIRKKADFNGIARVENMTNGMQVVITAEKDG